MGMRTGVRRPGSPSLSSGLDGLQHFRLAPKLHRARYPRGRQPGQEAAPSPPAECVLFLLGLQPKQEEFGIWGEKHLGSNLPQLVLGIQAASLSCIL